MNKKPAMWACDLADASSMSTKQADFYGSAPWSVIVVADRDMKWKFPCGNKSSV